MTDLTKLLASKGIILTNLTPGNNKTNCPKCQSTRKKNKNDKPLSVKIPKDLKSAIWNCHHCGWRSGNSGYEKERKKDERDEPNTTETLRSGDKPRDSDNVISPDFRKRRW